MKRKSFVLLAGLGVLALLPFTMAAATTVVHGSSGIYTDTVPGGATVMLVKLWGASGGGSSPDHNAYGGGGAFVRAVVPVTSGQQVISVVGQRGAYSTNTLGGAANGISRGGAPGGSSIESYGDRSQGGQASSLFVVNGGMYVMKAVAGGGGGASVSYDGGAGGNPGGNALYSDGSTVMTTGGFNGIGGIGYASQGGNYANNATTTGVAALNLAGGNGGDAAQHGGGGGGGYGGGGGGGSTGAGGGGGSYGDTIVGGSGPQPGNTADPDYASPAGWGVLTGEGNDGRIVVTFTVPDPPVATTLCSSNVTPSGATFFGNVVPNLADTTVWFRYGTNLSYGSTTAPVVVSRGAFPSQTVSASVCCLIPGVVYHFQLVASNVTAITYGADFTFVATTLQATSVTSSGATLNGTVYPNGGDTRAWFRYGLTTAYGNTTAPVLVGAGNAIPTPVPTPVGSLSANSIYHYQLVASNYMGVSYGGDATFMTGAKVAASQTIAGIYTQTVPSPANVMLVKMWGAGGGGGGAGRPGHGGGGAFVGVTIPVTPGQEFKVVVGQGGAGGTNNAGGVGNGISCGGAPGCEDGTNFYGLGQGGQASSLFYVNGDRYVTKAVAGAGGGSGYTDLVYVTTHGGPGGNPGGNGMSHTIAPATGGFSGTGGMGTGGGSPGASYASDATSVGVAAMSLVGGNGGNAAVGPTEGGGGGGGYGGGGGGGGDGMDGHSAGGGGGSYGDRIIGGSGRFPGNTNDPSYVVPAGQGNETTLYGVEGQNGSDGMVVVTFATTGTPGATTLAATDIRASSATFHGTVDPNLGNTTVWFRYGTATNYGSCSSTTFVPGTDIAPIAITNSMTNLIPGAVHHFQIVASNSAAVAYGEDLTFVPEEAPVVITLDPTGVTYTNATLNGTVNSMGADTWAWFRYGTTTNYGSTTTPVFFDRTNAAALPITAPLDLLNGQVYHFQLVATNHMGTAQGVDLTFATGARPSVATLAPSSIAATNAVMNGTVDSHGGDTMAWFRFGTTTNYGSATAPALVSGTNIGPVAFTTVANLLPYTVYHCQLVATNFMGVEYGSDVVFMTDILPVGTTNVFTASGIYTNVVPPSANVMLVKMWGAGGGGGVVDHRSGGGGAFVRYMSPVTNGQQFVAVVGQAGAASGAGLGGVWNGISKGGAPGYTSNYGDRGQGGQASSFFEVNGGIFRMKAVAGGGGGASLLRDGGAGGNPGYTGGQYSTSAPGTGGWDGSGGTGANSGGNYDTNAIDVGIPDLSLTGGNGGDGSTYGGGGGGGYGGGGGGADRSAGGGGGSYGDAIIAGNGACPGNTNDSNYAASAGRGGYAGNGIDGEIVVIFGITGLPGATTLAPANVAGSSTTLMGSVDPNFVDTTAWFRYGTTTNYSDVTATSLVGATNNAEVVVSNPVSSLLPNTLYHYQVVASNSFGLTYGADLTFVTAAQPIVVTLDTLSSTPSDAVLNGTVNPNGPDAFAWFEYGTTTSYGSTTAPVFISGTNVVAVQITSLVSNLTPSITYHFQLVASNAIGVSYGGDNTFVSEVPHESTNVFTTAGIYTNTAPNYCNAAVVKLWAAGGGGLSGYSGRGGGGAFVQKTIAVTNRQQFVIVVGERGSGVNGRYLGGVGNGISAGGISQPNNGLTYRQGGQASSLFVFKGGLFLTKAVAGAGGGAYEDGNGGAGGNPGGTGGYASWKGFYVPGYGGYNGVGGGTGSLATPGQNYSSDATTVGITSMNLAGGRGGNGSYSVSPGGGGGYGGGGGGGENTGGGGGGSLGDVVIGGVAYDAGNKTDPNYVAGAGDGGVTDGNDGMAVVIFKIVTCDVTTVAASNVMGASAVLNGTANPNGSSGRTWFEYGLTTNYSYSTALGSFDGAVTNVPFSVLVSGLSPRSDYHFRFVAANSVATNYGADLSFTTGLPVPGVTTLAATGETRTNAVLNGTVLPNDGETWAWFRYGATTAYGRLTVPVLVDARNTVAMAVTSLASSLLPGTLYHFQLVATNSGGTNYGADLTFNTAAPVVPVVVTSNAMASHTVATLHGTVDPMVTDAVAWFRYGTTTAYGSTTAPVPVAWTNTAAVDLTAQIGGLVPNTAYHFQLVATNVAGIAYGDDVTFNTAALVTPTVTTVGVTDTTRTNTTLTGTVVPNGSDTVAWFRYGATTNYGSLTAPVSVSWTNAAAVPVSGFAGGFLAGAPYHFQAVASNSVGLSYGNDVLFTTALPSLPSVTTLDATDLVDRSAVLNGTVNGYDGPADATAWFEYGASTGYGLKTAPMFISNTSAFPVTVTGLISNLVPFTTYHFRLGASNAAGISYGGDLTITNPMSFAGGTNVYATFGVYTSTVPVGVELMTVRLWGAGGGGGYGSMGQGGGGAFVEKTIPVTNWQQFVIVVGQGGAASGPAMGGIGNASISMGGAPGWAENNYANRGQGGQASSLFHINDGMFVMKAVAGAGGGAGFAWGNAYGGPGGNPGGNGGADIYGATGGRGGYNGAGGVGGGASSGAAYAAEATTTGITNLNQAGGNGGNGQNFSGGGGGGYGGGSGGFGGSGYTAAGGGGGGSYGDTIIGGGVPWPANTTDPNYVTWAGRGGGWSGPGNHGMAVVIFKIVIPEPTTLAATDLTGSSATLNGAVNPNDRAGTAWFEYGLTTNYDQITGSTSFGAGTNSVSINAPITNLLLNTTYHCRLVISATAGTNYGADVAFTTLAAPPVVATLDATNVTWISALLNGSVNPNEVATIAWFRYGTTTSYGNSTVPVAVGGTNVGQAVTGLLSNLVPETTYHFQIVAANNGGTNYGSDATFSTAVPSAPSATTLAASSVACTLAMLNGTVEAHGADTTVWYRYGTTTDYDRSTAPVVVGWSNGVPVTVPILVSDLVHSTAYHFQLVATNRAGASYGDDLTFTTLLPSLPSVTTVAATDVTRTNAMMNATVQANGSDTTVWFRYGATTNCDSSTAPMLVRSTNTAPVAVTASASGLVPRTVYYFQAVATNTVGASYGGELAFTTIAPSVPSATTLAATNTTRRSTVLNGTVDPNGADTTVWFRYGTTTNYDKDTTPLLLSWTNGFAAVPTLIGELVSGTVYHFQVVATNSEGITYGNDLVVTSSPPWLASVATLAVTGVTCSNAVLNGTVDPNDDGDVTTWFEYGPTTAYGNTTAPVLVGGTNGGAVAVSSLVSNLLTTTEYHFRLVASNVAGTNYGGDAMFLTAMLGRAVTNVYTASGIYTNLVPFPANVMKVKLWGAGGGNANSAGGGGAFVQQNLAVTNGQKFVVVVGQAGAFQGNWMGGVGNGISTGGAPGYGGDYNGRAQGAQASSLFESNNGKFFTKAVAGGGGGSGFSSPGNAGVAGPGVLANYNPDALTVGITNLSAAGGNGANGRVNTWSGGGGGGYGGGALGGDWLGGGGGGSYGDTRIGGSGSSPGNASDSDHVGSAGYAANSGMAVVIFQVVTPEATTLPATDVATYSAVLNGSVNPEGCSGSTWFEYGLDTNYGQVTASTNFDAGTNNLSFAMTATGLLPLTTYHVRCVTGASGGTNYGADVSFTTAPAPPVVITLAATSVTRTNTLLNGSVDHDGGDTIAWFRYGTTTNYGSTTVPVPVNATNAVPMAVSGLASGLAGSTLYHFQLVAGNAGGTNYGADVTFTTAAPTAPTIAAFGATNITRVSATLAATVDPNGADGVVWFRYGTTAAYGSTTATALASSTNAGPVEVAVAAGGLIPATLYHFQAVATNSAGTTYGDDMTFTTAAPSMPDVTTLDATNTTRTNAVLGGAVGPNGADATAWFCYGTTTNYGSTTVPVIISWTNAAAVHVPALVNGLLANTLYHFQLVATNSSGSNYGVDLTFTTPMPSLPTPTTVDASNTTVSNAVLNGTINCDGHAEIAAWFEYGATASYGSTTEPVLFSATNDLPLAVSTLVSNLATLTLYHFRVVASNVTGTAYGDDLTFTTAMPLEGVKVVYSSAGIYTNTVPSPANVMRVKLWGAGGGRGMSSLGGGGAFAQRSIAVQSGQRFVLVVGQGGAQGGVYLGGQSNGRVSMGGAPGYQGDYNSRGQGGQASSLFFLSAGNFVTKAVAGAGGGGGLWGGSDGGAGGNPGANGGGPGCGGGGHDGIGGTGGGYTGGNYAAEATTTGVTALDQAGGNGGSATGWSGGGGGGYGGGAGGAYGGVGSTGGGGGGSYGDDIIGGSGWVPGNAGDSDYIAGAGEGGLASEGHDGMVVVMFEAVSPTDATTLPATNLIFSSAMLHGSCNPNGAPAIAWFEYGLTTNYGQVTVSTNFDGGTNSFITVAVTGLSPHTEYHFRLVAVNGVGTNYGADLSFTTLNRAPIAGSDRVGTMENRSVDLPLAKLLANDRDLDGDAISITAVSATSTNGGTLVLGATSITYTPVPGFSGADEFSYTLIDAFGETNMGVVTVTVTPGGAPAQNMVSISSTVNGKLIQFAGIPGQKYIIQSADVVDGPYTDLSPELTAGPTGIIEYEDTTFPPPGSRFYRTVVVP